MVVAAGLAPLAAAGAPAWAAAAGTLAAAAVLALAVAALAAAARRSAARRPRRAEAALSLGAALLLAAMGAGALERADRLPLRLDVLSRVPALGARITVGTCAAMAALLALWGAGLLAIRARQRRTGLQAAKRA